MRAQQFLEVRLLESRVALEVGLIAGVDNRVDLGPVDRGVKLGPLRSLHAVRRPGPSLRLEGGVVGRMPVARGHNQVEAAIAQQLASPSERSVPVRDGERAALGEVVLEVDDQQARLTLAR